MAAAQALRSVVILAPRASRAHVDLARFGYASALVLNEVLYDPPGADQPGGFVEILERFARCDRARGSRIGDRGRRVPGIWRRVMERQHRSFWRRARCGSWRATACTRRRALPPTCREWPRRHPVAAWRRSPRRPRLWDARRRRALRRPSGGRCRQHRVGTRTRRTRDAETTPPTSSPPCPRPAAAPGQMVIHHGVGTEFAGTTLDGHWKVRANALSGLEKMEELGPELDLRAIALA